MAVRLSDQTDVAESNLGLEWVRLVNLCARWTGDHHAAEDVTQETLAEAWLHQDELRDPTRRWQWLAGIARNRFLHWRRRHFRDSARATPVRVGRAGETVDPLDELADGCDLEVELERSELVQLIERALGVLPPLTRSALIERYVDDRPQFEVAQRHGVSEGAVEARLHRGKLALRKVLATELRSEAAAYGLLRSLDAAGWQETRLWCPLCGVRRLTGSFVEGHRRLLLRCQDCLPLPDFNVADSGGLDIMDDIKGYRAGLKRLLSRVAFLIPAEPRARGASCPACRAPLRFRVEALPFTPVAIAGRQHLVTDCPGCQLRQHSLLGGLALASPEGRRFWAENPRIRALPEQVLDVEGESALVVRFAAICLQDRYEAALSLGTLRVLRTSGANGG